MQLYLAVMGEEVWRQYSSWWSNRGLPPPSPTTQAILAQSEDGTLLGGALCYPTDGKFLLIEHLACHPSLSPRDAHTVTLFMAKCAVNMGALVCKVPIILAKGGIGQTLERAGFQDQGLTAFVAFPGRIPQKEAPLASRGRGERGQVAATGEEPPAVPKVRRRKSAVKKKKPEAPREDGDSTV